MTRRYPHWLATAKEGMWPTAVVTVDCVSHLVTNQSDRTRSDERLLSWHAVSMVRCENDYGPVACTSARDPDYWWTQLADKSDTHENLWVVSYRCGRVWTLLGLWERIEDGRITISGSDYRSDQSYHAKVKAARQRSSDPLRQFGGSELSRLARGHNGYIVMEDPPCIVVARVLWSKRLITWIDIRNHGVESCGEHMPGHDTALWLAEWVQRASQLCRQYGLGALQTTAGSQAMRAFRHTYYSGGIYVSTDGGGEKLEREGYCGGRCEARRIGIVRQPTFHVDFRSCYAAVCVEYRYPVRLSAVYSADDGENQPASDDYTACIARVTVHTSEPAYPYRRDGEIVWPIGRFTTTLCGPELADAVAHGRVVKWHQWAIYEMEYALAHYATCLYRMRCEVEDDAVAGISTWAKRLLVALPGKLGQKNHRWVDALDLWSDKLYGEWHHRNEDDSLTRCRSIGGNIQRDYSDGYAADSVPAMAAWVTSWGRMKLLNAIRTAGWNEVLYHDTDSLFVTERGYAALCSASLVAEKALGALQLRSQSMEVEFRGIKYYCEDGRVTCAGLPRGEITDLGDGKHYIRRLSPTEQARRGARPAAVVVYGEYARADAYKHGVVHTDGTVTPLVIEE